MNLLYRSLITSAAALCSTMASADILMEIVCQECRGTEHSVDFGNYAFNQTYGVNSTIFQDELIVFNLDGGWVHVDLSFELEENIISNIADFIGLDLGVPTGVIIIETTTDATVNHEYSVSLNMVDTTGPLPVGENTTPPPAVGGGGGGGGGDGSGGGGTGGGGVGAGGGSGGGGGGGSGSGGGGGTACTSAGNGDWYCVAY